MQVLFFCRLHLDEHQEIHHPHLFISYHGRTTHEVPSTPEEANSQDRVPENAKSVKVNIQLLPGKHPYTVMVKINATTTVQQVLDSVETLFTSEEDPPWPAYVQLKAKIKGKWIILDPTKLLLEINLSNTTLQDFVFFLHVPDAEMVAVVTSGLSKKEYKVS